MSSASSRRGTLRETYPSTRACSSPRVRSTVLGWSGLIAVHIVPPVGGLGNAPPARKPSLRSRQDLGTTDRAAGAASLLRPFPACPVSSDDDRHETRGRP